MSIAVFDVSEFQGVINWPAVVDPGIIRVHNSNRPDNYAQPNIAGARRYCPWRGWYQYLTAGADPVKAAHDFQATLGPTLPGEVMILDLEAGTGDQRARRQAWLNALQDPIEWTYSGLSFARAHLPGVRVDWIAAYGQGEPTDSHTLWQNTDARRFAGIANPCDGSLFNGTLAQLQTLTRATPEVDMTPEEHQTLTDTLKFATSASVRAQDLQTKVDDAVRFATSASIRAQDLQAQVAALALVVGTLRNSGVVGVTPAAIVKAINADTAKRYAP